MSGRLFKKQEIVRVSKFHTVKKDYQEAECKTCGFGTYVSVANKGATDLDSRMD